jgi:8-oxo-dGTP diphosphatase
MHDVIEPKVPTQQKYLIKIAWTPIIDHSIPFARSRGQELFYNLGGKLEPDETHEQALVREVGEEAGVFLKPETIRHVHTFEGVGHALPPDVKLRMVCFDAEYIGNIVPSNEVVEIVNFTTKDLERTTPMGKEILKWFHERNLID